MAISDAPTPRSGHPSGQRSLHVRDELVLQVKWSATSAVPVLDNAAGKPMSASFAVFMTFEGDLLLRPRNDDRLDPGDVKPMQAGQASSGSAHGRPAPET